MKKLTTFLTLISTAAFFSSTTMAKTPTTAISFDKGSYCGYFEGDMTERDFTLTLQANQKLVISTYEAYVDSVTDSKGNKIKDVGGEMMWVYDIKNSGKYIISTYGNHDDSAEFCVF